MLFQSGTLPVLPSVHARVRATLSSAETSLEDCVALVESDPALAIATYRVAAEVVAGDPLPPDRTLLEAVHRIGGVAVRRLATLHAGRSRFDELRGSELDPHEFWRHSVASALVARALAARTGEVFSGVRFAYLCGLLHDIGRLALAAREPRSYARVQWLAAQGVPATEAERRLFGYSHADLGQRMARYWRLPREVATAAGFHHAPDEASDRAPAALVAEAVRITNSLGVGDGLSTATGVTYPERAGDAELLDSFGGPIALIERIAGLGSRAEAA